VAERFSFDTNCLVAILSGWHPHHQESRRAFDLMMRKNAEGLVLAAHTYLECFSVLTRMPKPMRIEPQPAREAIDKAFGHATRAIPSLELYDSILEACATTGNAGGLAYNALIANTVYREGARCILTWNAKHMKLVAPAGLEVLRPDMVLI
jgi:predicted nucleic acid-binding protein